MARAKRVTKLEVPHTRARRLRRDQTDAELLLWQQLRARRFLGFKFRRQFPIDRFIVDFCSPHSGLVIELDGGQHVDARRKDDWRTAILARRGYRVLRFWDSEVLTNIDGVMLAILDALGAPSP